MFCVYFCCHSIYPTVLAFFVLELASIATAVAGVHAGWPSHLVLAIVGAPALVFGTAIALVLLARGWREECFLASIKYATEMESARPHGARRRRRRHR